MSARISSKQKRQRPQLCADNRRKRTHITRPQLDILEGAFKEDPWPTRRKKAIIATKLGSSINFVSVWFQNRRARAKRESTDPHVQAEHSTVQNNDHEYHLQHNLESVFKRIRNTSDGKESCSIDVEADETNIAKPHKTDEAIEVDLVDTDDIVVDGPVNLSLKDSSQEEDQALPSDVFHAVVNMVAIEEGGIIERSHPSYSQAVNDSLYGIIINNTSRLLYDTDNGLYFTEHEQ